MKHSLRFFATLGLMVGLTIVLSGAQKSPNASVPPQLPLDVTLTPLALQDAHGVIQKGQRYGGFLRFRGAYRLTCPHPDFGGVSSLAAQGNTAYALSDTGLLLSLTPHWKGTQLTAMRLNQVVRLKDGQGQALPSSSWRDSEGMTMRPNGTLHISFERHHRVDHYAADGTWIDRVPLSDSVLRKLPYNGSMESIIQLDPEHFFAIGEFSTNKKDQLRAWIIGRSGGEQPLLYTPAKGYGVSEMRMLPNGDVLAIERAYRVFTWPWRFATRMTLIARKDIAPGAVVVPKVLAEFDQRSGAGNLEAATTIKLPNGKVMLMVMSDDNFNPQQQANTLLLFEVRPVKPGKHIRTPKRLPRHRNTAV